MNDPRQAAADLRKRLSRWPGRTSCVRLGSRLSRAPNMGHRPHPAPVPRTMEGDVQTVRDRGLSVRHAAAARARLKGSPTKMESSEGPKLSVRRAPGRSAGPGCRLGPRSTHSRSARWSPAPKPGLQAYELTLPGHQGPRCKGWVRGDRDFVSFPAPRFRKA